MINDKLTTVQAAVSEYLHDGDSLCLGGVCARDPMAITYEIIRQKKRDLILIGDSRMDNTCMLMGAGCISKLEAAYCGVGVIGNALNFRNAVEKGIPRFIEVEEYSNYGASLRLLAGAMNIPFLPVRSMLGSDIPKHNPKIKIIEDPYSGDPIALVPAVKPDVAFIHVQRADKMGNSQIWGVTNNDINIARASKKVIITCEKLVPTSEIRKHPDMTVIPHYCVDAVVEVPYGAHPLWVCGEYWCDVPFRRAYLKTTGSQAQIDRWLDEWVYGLKDFDEYLEKVGRDRLARLTEMEHDNYRFE